MNKKTKISFFPISELKNMHTNIRPLIENVFSKNASVAVKLHMGEPGNPNFIQPCIVQSMISVLKELGANPFLFDSPVMYGSPRNTVKGYSEVAKKHGFSEETIGCPVIISDDFIVEKTANLAVQVCKHLAEADALLVLTHLKGHGDCGFGGSIKNLGMGAVSKQSKRDIHVGAKPLVNSDKCNSCKLCSANCPFDSISFNKKAVINHSRCFGCGICIYNCPQKALYPQVALFDELISEAAGAVLSQFDPESVFFVNILNNITEKCDCWSAPGKVIAKDIGIVAGVNIVAVDKASLDLIEKSEGKDVFREVHHKSPNLHIMHAKKIGLGSMKYDLK